jgi:GNAT superfamily N-acetyltransferase
MEHRDFIASENAELINSAVSPSGLPEGMTVRIVDFNSDIEAIRVLPARSSTINPLYGMTSSETADEITLIALFEGEVVGHISAEMQIGRGCDMDLHVSGVFVSEDHQSKGIGRALGICLLSVAETWRRLTAEENDISVEGGISVTSDTEPGTAGAALISGMDERCDQIWDVASFDANGPEPC